MAVASKDQLKRMIMQFRITELQSMLEYAGERNTQGRKKELQKRCISLITSRRTTLLSNKVVQLYKNRKRYKANNSDDSSKDNSYYPNASYKEKFRFFRNEYAHNWNCGGYEQENFPTKSGFPISSINDVTDSSSSSDECSTSKLDMLRNTYNSFDKDYLQNIKFKKLPFYEYCSDITSVIPLLPRSHEEDTFHCNIPFLLNLETLSCVKQTDSTYQVQLRMCILNHELEVNDSLPAALWVKVNEKYSTLPPPIASTNRQGMLLKRMNVPINITDEVERVSTYNKISINWSSECEELYGLAVHLVRKYSADELIDKLRKKGERDRNITKKVIYDNLNDDEDEIAATSLKMSLTCPLGKILISLPVRASTCNHLQCFDGSLYIKMNDVKSTWQCPVCNLTCLYENLFIDGYFAEVLRSERLPPGVTEIQLEADGTWDPVINVSKSKPKEPPASPVVPKKFDAAPTENSIKKSTVDLISESDSNMGSDLPNEFEDFLFYHLNNNNNNTNNNNNINNYDYNNNNSSSSSNSNNNNNCNNNNCNMNQNPETESYRSPTPPTPFSHFLDVKRNDCNDSDLSVLSTNSESNNSSPRIPKKRVTLVDLTFSDSDSDSGPTFPISENIPRSEFRRPSFSPPVYDISDSDCEEL